MIVSFVKNHPVTQNKVSNTSFLISLDSIVPAGNLIVARIVFDNAATASKPLITSIGKAAGETANWLLLGQVNSASTTAGAFGSAAMFAIRTTVDWPIGNYQVVFDTATVQKGGGIQEFSGVLAALRSTSGTNYSTTTTAASAATTGTAPVVGDLALGYIFGSNAAANQAGDNDTTGGSWSAVAGVGSTGGNVATNNFGVAQYKIVTSTSHQTLNNSAAMTAGNGAIVAILQAVPDPAITQAAYQFFDDAGTEAGAASLAAQNTAINSDITSGDDSVALRIRLQSTTSAPVDAFDDFQLQWEKNASGSWFTPGTDILADSYPESNYDAAISTLSTAGNFIGQSFLGNGKALKQVKFWGYKQGVPTDNIVAYLYAHSGTFGATSVGTGSPLATSAPVAASSVTGTVTVKDWIEPFIFDGTFTLVAGTPYVIVIGRSGATDLSNYIFIGVDSAGSPTHSGNQAILAGVNWASDFTRDVIFELYTTGGAVVPYNAPSLTDGAATTNRLGAGSGSFVAGKISEDGLVDNLGWTANNYTELLYSITLKQAALINGDVLRFRVLRNDSITGMTYTATPTINVVSAAAGGKIKVWNGSAWVEKPMKVWNGSAWVEKPVKVWNGSAWVLS